MADTVVDTRAKRRKDGTGAVDRRPSGSDADDTIVDDAAHREFTPPLAAVTALLAAAVGYRRHLDDSPALGRAVRVLARDVTATPTGGDAAAQVAGPSATALATEATTELHRQTRVAIDARDALRAFVGGDSQTASDGKKDVATAALPAADVVTQCLLDDVAAREVCLLSLRRAGSADFAATSSGRANRNGDVCDDVPPEAQLPLPALRLTAYAAVAGPLLLQRGALDAATATLAGVVAVAKPGPS